MKIISVKATSHSVPIHIPLLKEPEMGSCVVVRIQTEDGVTGVGYTSGRQTRKAIRDLINNTVGPTIIGKDAMDTEAFMTGFIKRADIRQAVGIYARAFSAIDIALWDAKGKAFKQPVYKLLGGYSGRVPVYATYGVMDYTREQLVEAAKMRVADGWNRLKMVVCIDNSNNVPEDAARVGAVRKAVGDNVELMFDANQQFNLFQATDLCRMTEQYNIRWFEEPVAHNEPSEMRILRSRTKIPLAAGHGWEFAWQSLKYLEGRAVDISQTDVAIAGGFTEGIKIAHLTQIYALPLATHGWPALNMHLVAANPCGWRVEFHVSEDELGKAIFTNQPKPVGDWATCYDKPGLGLELNEDTLKKTQDKD